LSLPGLLASSGSLERLSTVALAKVEGAGLRDARAISKVGAVPKRGKSCGFASGEPDRCMASVPVADASQCKNYSDAG
jgi:hypothetical protein